MGHLQDVFAHHEHDGRNKMLVESSGFGQIPKRAKSDDPAGRGDWRWRPTGRGKGGPPTGSRRGPRKEPAPRSNALRTDVPYVFPLQDTGPNCGDNSTCWPVNVDQHKIRGPEAKDIPGGTCCCNTVEETDHEHVVRASPDASRAEALSLLPISLHQGPQRHRRHDAPLLPVQVSRQTAVRFFRRRIYSRILSRTYC